MKKFLLGTAVLALSTGTAYAASTIVQTDVAVTQTAIAIETTGNLSFGTFEITSGDAAGIIDLGSNGVLATNATNIVHNGGQSLGSVTVTGTAFAPIDFSCSPTATLTHDTDTTQTMAVNVWLGAGVCADGVISNGIGGGGSRGITVGGRLSFDSPIVGAYSSANPGGTPITVDVVYQ